MPIPGVCYLCTMPLCAGKQAWPACCCCPWSDVVAKYSRWALNVVQTFQTRNSGFFFFFFPTIFAYLAYIVSTWWSQEASTVNTACTCMCLNSQSVYLPDRAGRLLWQGVSHTYAQLFNSLGLSGGSFHFVFCNTCPSVEGRIYRLQKMSKF